MADRNRQPYKPTNRRHYFASSSNSDQTHNPSSKPKSWNPNSTRDANTQKASNFDTVNDGKEEDLSPFVVGTCLLMCPVSERERRERLRDLAVFERLHGNPAKTSSSLAVKKVQLDFALEIGKSIIEMFCRTISHKDLQASDVRPIPVLEDTLNYLLNLLNSSDHPFEVVHDFIFDRTRSIRQDLSMQNAVSDQVIHMYERMVKFHISSYHHLRKSSETTYSASMTQLNQEQLMKTLTTLLNLYDSNRASKSVCRDEPEFVSLYLLLHLGSHNQEPLSLWFRRIPSPILNSREMCFARRIQRYYRLGNYIQFIRTAEAEASFLQYCIIEPHINKVRVLALSCISYGSYKLQPYPLLHLSKVLMMKEYDVESLCIDCALELSNDGTAKGLSSTKQCSINKSPGGICKYYPLLSERIERLCTESLKL